MASKSKSEGRDAIDAAERRLAAAKKWESSAAESLKDARSEVAEAESFLGEAREKWRDAVDTDSVEGGTPADVGDEEEEEEDDEGVPLSSLAKKVESSSEEESDEEEVVEEESEDEAVRNSNKSCDLVGDGSGGRKRGASKSPEPARDKKMVTRLRGGTTAPGSPSSSDTVPADDDERVEEIVVGGAGTSGVNGTYRLRRSHDGLPDYVDESYPVFSMRGYLEDMPAEYVIYRGAGILKRFTISCIDNRGEEVQLYKSSADVGPQVLLPPKSRWARGPERGLQGTDPAPRLNWTSNNNDGTGSVEDTMVEAVPAGGSNEEAVEEITVEGAGTPEVNGIYGLRQSRAGLGGHVLTPVFSKSGTWEGKSAEYMIYKTVQGTILQSNEFGYVHTWWLTCISGGEKVYFYEGEMPLGSLKDFTLDEAYRRPTLPPKEKKSWTRKNGWVGWEATSWSKGGRGSSPEPQLKW